MTAKRISGWNIYRFYFMCRWQIMIALCGGLRSRHFFIFFFSVFLIEWFFFWSINWREKKSLSIEHSEEMKKQRGKRVIDFDWQWRDKTTGRAYAVNWNVWVMFYGVKQTNVWHVYWFWEHRFTCFLVSHAVTDNETSDNTSTHSRMNN